MPEVLDWRNATEVRQLVERAAQALIGGQIVAFPTETYYVLAADASQPEAVARLASGQENPAFLLALRGSEELADWVPNSGSLARRLARRCWPGPMTLLVDHPLDEGFAGRLPESVRVQLTPHGCLALRMPAHEAILETMELLPAPLVLAGTHPDTPAATIEELMQSAGERFDLLIDDGPCRYGRPSTVVRVQGEEYRIEREGVFDHDAIRRQATCLIVFVCTGNTCRSPLAEVLCKKLLAERLGCAVDELPLRGFLVLSAGLAAMMGGTAAQEAVEIAKEQGADLSGHSSRPLSPELLRQADHVIGMTRSHLYVLMTQQARMATVPRVLSTEGEDIPDPIGSDLPVYRACAAQISQQLEKLVAELLG